MLKRGFMLILVLCVLPIGPAVAGVVHRDMGPMIAFDQGTGMMLLQDGTLWFVTVNRTLYEVPMSQPQYAWPVNLDEMAYWDPGYIVTHGGDVWVWVGAEFQEWQHAGTLPMQAVPSETGSVGSMKSRHRATHEGTSQQDDGQE